ncbi:MAG: TRAP transporter small permease subunit, partial [Proteobacteria bacterium]|nr:TRAP transporter small permease subunit [Pseudomonadota bacterium]
MKAGHLPAPPSPVDVAPGGAIGICDLVLRGMCAATLMFIMLLTLVDVFMRYWLHNPITGSAELVMFAMAIFIFSAFPLVTLRGQHISVAILRGRFSGVWAW